MAENNKPQVQVQKIAIDLGYGDTKVKTSSKEFKFASAVEKRKETQTEFSEKAEQDVYVFNGKRYTVGDRALTNAVSTRGFNFLVKYSPIVIYHAIKKAGLDTSKPIELVTGLSIVNWAEREDFLEAIKVIQVNGDSIEFDSITLRPQGRGIFDDFDGDKSGIVCVSDIGYNTYDFLVYENGEPNQELSYATKKGANEIIIDIQTKIKKRFQIDVSEQTAKDIFMKGEIEIYGEKQSLKDEIEDAKEDYTNFILDEMRSQRSDLLKTARTVIFSGGGAYFIQDTKIMPKNVAFSKKPYEFANVRGYFNGTK